LVPWFVAVGLLAVVLAEADLEAMPGLFQSVLPTVALPPTSIPSPSIAVTEALTPTSTLPPPTIPATNTLAPPATESPTQAPVPAISTEPPPVPPATEPPALVASPPPAEEERYPQEAANLRFDWRMLFDSAALGIAYLWLACGLVLFLVVSAVFAYLWWSGARRRQRE
jgi:hypothetical protein